jgi:site-specific DNA recombinase
MSTPLIVALYARVSSDQQAKTGTIDSQIAALHERIARDGHPIAEDLQFVDAGVSGATLIRPQLERLRDHAAVGAIDRLYVLSPDRLSRKYAHQVLLLEELTGCGVEVFFLNHRLGTTPEEELLLQMQGMISEYERAKIMERNRRGKLHGAKRGSVNVLSTAPYGYRYIRKQTDGGAAQYVIDLEQAATVRRIFHWVGVERLSIGEVVRRLDDAGIETSSGKAHWDRSVVWGMLQNPAYMGRAAFGKTRTRTPLPRVRAQRHSADVPKKGVSTVRTEREDWIEIPVPALVSEALFTAVQEQLEENRKRARQGRRGAAYLLQGLTVCGHCGYAYYGKTVSKAAAKGGQSYAYYRCIGTDAYRFGGERICDNKQVRTERLDALVWQQVRALLAQPQRLKQEYERRLDLHEHNEGACLDTEGLQRQKRHLESGRSRLIDSYAEGIIDKADFEPKMAQLKTKLGQIEAQIEATRQHQAGQLELFLVINRLEEFAAAVTDRLATIDFQTKREILCALVKRIEIYKDEVVVVFRVDPDPGFDTGENSTDTDAEIPSMQDCTRRHDAALWRSFVGVAECCAVHDASVQPFADQPHDPTIIDPTLDEAPQPAPVDVVEESRDVCVVDPSDAVRHALLTQLREGVMGVAPFPKAIGTREKVLLIYRSHQHRYRFLYDLVFDLRDPDRAFLAVVLVDPHALDRRSLVGLRAQALVQPVQVGLQVLRVVPRVDPAQPRRSIAPQPVVGLSK